MKTLNKAGTYRDLSLICSRIDVSRSLFREYRDEAFTSPITESGFLSQKEVTSLFKKLVSNLKGAPYPYRVKFINTLLKLSDGILGFPVGSHTEKRELIKELRSLKVHKKFVGAKIDFRPLPSPHPPKQRNLWNAVFFYYPGPTANAYFYSLARSGYLPSKVVIINDPRRKKRKTCRIDCSPSNLRGIEIESQGFLLQLLKRLPSIDVHVHEGGVNSSRLCDLLSSFPENLAIFSGGGILSTDVLKRVKQTIFHVHPGHLPDIRGADGLFYSVLLKGCPTATIFHMDAGLDTGEIASRCELEFPRVPRVRSEHISLLYRGLLDTFDPWCRAKALVDFLDKSFVKGCSAEAMPTYTQQCGQGMSFHFMHPQLRERVLEEMMR